MGPPGSSGTWGLERAAEGPSASTGATREARSDRRVPQGVFWDRLWTRNQGATKGLTPGLPTGLEWVGCYEGGLD